MKTCSLAKFTLRALCAAALLIPSVALANDYQTNSTNDRLTSRSLVTGETRVSQIESTTGNWRFWSNFGGFQGIWVYTSTDHNGIFLWNGTTYQLIANFDEGVGSTFQADIRAGNRGAVRQGARGSLTTAAGQFDDVIRLDFEVTGASGVSSIFFARGVGVVKWTEVSSSGEDDFELVSGLVGGVQFPQNNTTTDAPAFPPTEHVEMETILWGCADTYIVLETYRDAFTGLNNSGVAVQVIVDSNAVASQLEYDMAVRNVPMGNVEVLIAATDSVWMRDYGPIVMLDGSGRRSVADLDYYFNRRNDNAIPAAYAGYRGWPRVKINVSMEGGNFFTNGRETLICSEGVFFHNPRMSQNAIEREFAKMNITNTVYMEPLIQEGTTHVDMFMRILNDNTALVSSYPAGHRQNRVVDACANRLRQLGYNVLRAQADSRYDEFATYSNSTLANGIALVPNYSNASLNAAANRVYESAGFTVVPTDSRKIIKYAGATHCVSMQIPAGR